MSLIFYIDDEQHVAEARMITINNESQIEIDICFKKHIFELKCVHAWNIEIFNNEEQFITYIKNISSLNKMRNICDWLVLTMPIQPLIEPMLFIDPFYEKYKRDFHTEYNNIKI